MMNTQLQANSTAFGVVPDLDLAQFFTQDQIDFFGMDSPENGLLAQEDRVVPNNMPFPGR